ncbi:hypothetical protein LN893_08825 [Pontibacter sp. XAAS-A31]|nr:hypothetical protein [Pontibacter harenae]
MLIVLLMLFSTAAGRPVASIAPITLQAEKLAFTPKEFYIKHVIDERADRKAVAYLLPIAPVNMAPAAAGQPVDLEGGGVVAIRKFIKQSLPANTKLRPVTIRLKEYKVTEKPGAKSGRVNGHLTAVMSFEMQRDGETVHLLDYKGGARYDRPASQHNVVEPTLRRSLADALNYLNIWMNQEANKNEKLASGVKVFFSDYTTNEVGDTVFYNTARPIKWTDFRGKQSKPSSYSATIFPSFAYAGESKVIDGYVHLNLQMKVYMLQNSSWSKSGDQDAYGLNHEQRHFDLVKLVAERYKQKIETMDLTVADYNSMIQYEFLESFREMNHLQEQYDGETRHGIDAAAQHRWNQRIEAELKSFGIK